MWNPFRKKDREPTNYDLMKEQVYRLCNELRGMNSSDPHYDEVLEKITTLQAQMASDKAIRRRIHPDEKKVIATGATIAGLIGLNYYLDNKGEAISGKAQRIGENLLSTGTRMLNIFKF